MPIDLSREKSLVTSTDDFGRVVREERQNSVA